MKKNTSTYWTLGIVVLVALGLLWLGNTGTPPATQSNSLNPNTLPGIQAGNAPWDANVSQLAARLHTIGLPALSAEGTALHIHQHLDIFIDGTKTTIPADIGINNAAQFISPIHVHDATGVIHVESPTVETFTLGQFFDVWGVRLTDTCLGEYCNTTDKILQLFVNGAEIKNSFRSVALDAHQEIVFAYGTPKELPNPIPATFSFDPGL